MNLKRCKFLWLTFKWTELPTMVKNRFDWDAVKKIFEKFKFTSIEKLKMVYLKYMHNATSVPC